MDLYDCSKFLSENDILSMSATLGDVVIFMVGKRFVIENIIFLKSMEPVNMESFPMLTFLPFGKSKSLSRFAYAA